MPDLSDSIGEVGGAIRAMLGLTRHSRIRDQLKGTIELYALVEKYSDLSQAKEALAKIITSQSSSLLETATTTRRKWSWGPAFLAWIVSGLFGLAAFYLAPSWGLWWATLLLFPVGVGGTLFAAVGLALLLERKSSTA